MSDADAALHHLFEANRLLRDAGERIAGLTGQTHARRMVLQAAGAGATVPDIARRLGLHRQGVQRIADELVAEGLARYDENPRHRISKRFIVTDLGGATLSMITEAHAAWITALETRRRTSSGRGSAPTWRGLSKPSRSSSSRKPDALDALVHQIRNGAADRYETAWHVTEAAIAQPEPTDGR